MLSSYKGKGFLNSRVLHLKIIFRLIFPLIKFLKTRGLSDFMSNYIFTFIFEYFF